MPVQLRIAVVSDAIWPYNKGGKEQRIFRLTTGLAKLGHDVHIYTMQWWDGAPDRIENGVHLHAISPYWPLYAGERRSIKQGLLFGLATLKLVRERFDIIEADHMPYFPLYAARIVSLIKRRPLYATWHEVWSLSMWHRYLGPAGIIAYVIERISVHLPTHIIAASAHTAERLRTIMHTSRPVSVVNNGIDLSAMQAIKPAKLTSDLVLVGRLLAHKNPDLLIRAVGLLRATRPRLRCVIVGEGPEYDRLSALITELGLTKNVTLTGRVENHDEVFSYVKASRVFVLPSTREGFGIVALEAMACGLPVITIDHPDNAARHLVTPGHGALCQPTPESLAAAIDTLLATQFTGDPAQAAAAYDWSRSTDHYAKVYVS